MGTYRVRHLSEGAIELGGIVQFDNLAGATVWLRDHVQVDENGTPTQFGFVIDAVVHADSADQALELVAYPTEAAISIVCLAVSAVSSLRIPVSVIDVSPDVTSREFVQQLPAASELRPRRKFDPATFVPLFDHLNAVPEQSASRVFRAVRWYRKALLEDELFDQFSNLWTGLEVINELIKQRHNLPIDRPVRSCPACNAPVVLTPTNTGIEWLITELAKEPRAAWKKAQKVRNGLSHGFEDLGTLTLQVKAIVPILRRALLLGILELLNVPEELRSSFVREPLAKAVPPFVKVQALIHGVSAGDILSEKSDPHFEITSFERHSIVEQGVRRETIKPEIAIKGLSGPATYTLLSIAFVGAKDPEDSQASASISTSTDKQQ